MNTNGTSPVWHGKLFSNGWVVPRGGVAKVIDPSSGDLLGVTGVANGEDVAAAARAAKEAQKKWAAVPFSERAAILRTAAEKLRRARGRIRRLECARVRCDSP